MSQEKTFETYNMHGVSTGQIVGELLCSYGAIIRCANGLFIKAADISPANGSPMVTAYISVKVITQQ